MSELAKADAVEFRRSLLRDVARQPDNTADGDQLRGWAYRIRTGKSVRELSDWNCVTTSPEAAQARQRRPFAYELRDTQQRAAPPQPRGGPMALAGREERASQAHVRRFGNGEFADLLIVLGEAHLRRDPDEVCCLLQRAEELIGLLANAPIHRAIQHVGGIASEPVVGGGLHYHYCRI